MALNDKCRTYIWHNKNGVLSGVLNRVTVLPRIQPTSRWHEYKMKLIWTRYNIRSVRETHFHVYSSYYISYTARSFLWNLNRYILKWIISQVTQVLFTLLYGGGGDVLLHQLCMYILRAFYYVHELILWIFPTVIGKNVYRVRTETRSS